MSNLTLEQSAEKGEKDEVTCDGTIASLQVAVPLFTKRVQRTSEGNEASQLHILMIAFQLSTAVDPKEEGKVESYFPSASTDDGRVCC